MNDTLSQWEKELIDTPASDNPIVALMGRRILALIDLVRKKDEALREAIEQNQSNGIAVPELWSEALEEWERGE